MMQTDQHEKQPILVVEDDTHMQAALSKALRQQGYSVMLARDGHEGIQRLEQDGAW